MQVQHEPTLSLEGLTLERRGRCVLDQISLSARAGEVVAILGPNGAGKSTLLQVVAGLLPGARGRVVYAGKALGSLTERSRVLWYMPDDVVLPDEASLADALGLCATSPLIQELNLGGLLQAGATAVSHGESKRAQLAAALGSERPVLLLDEPFGAFDPRELGRVLPVFRRHLGRSTALVSVHQMHVAERCADRLLLLAEGKRVAFGTLDELRAQAGCPGAPLDEVFLHLLQEAPGALA